MIPITDYLPISLRAYAQVPKARKAYRGLGALDWTLTFDCETQTDAGQALRFGAYQLRKGGDLKFSGLFYDPAGVSSVELETLRAFTKRERLALLTRDQFVDEILFLRAYQLRARIIGFNLPFDISRLAVAHGPARGSMYGGFTFTLSKQKIYPHIRVKHLSRRCALIDFAAPYRQRDSRGQIKRELQTPVRRGYFVDVNTLATSLLSQGFTLASLSRTLKVPNPKLEFDDFDGPIDDAMITYAVRDVQITWECYQVLMGKLDGLGLSDLRPEEIYSEASIGKGYLQEMGIAPWREMQPDFPPDMLGRILSSYYGGRSEIRIRRQVRQVILCDFLSMYPTVCTLMGLWRFVIASGIVQRDATLETRDFVASVSLADLQAPGIWQKLAVLVNVLPGADIFPVRAAYDREALATIGSNYLTSATPQWFTLADCIASKLLTGKAPQIVEAVAFEPGPMQPDLQPINISGDAAYRVDPTTTDFFKRVIELRKATQERKASASGDDLVDLDTKQHQLKICVNSSSYGIFMQVNVAKRSKRFTATVFGQDGRSFERETDKAEKPGQFFHPLLGTLITGAARLMLAITESQIAAQGLEWAFCDTDSMAIAKPDGMAGDEFRQRVQFITEWFANLNPYDFPGSILKIESENAGLESKQPEPLFCWAVSSKRYALFNLSADGTPILRKVSAHGLGHLLPPYKGANPPSDIPAPPDSVMRNGVERWHCDLWFEIVSAGLGAKPEMPRLDFHPALNSPAVSRYGATAPELLGWFKSFNSDREYRDQVKPFGFLLSLSKRRDWSEQEAIAPQSRRGRPAKKVQPKPVAPFDKGTTKRRHIHASGICHIGKEANELDRQQTLGADDTARPDYGPSNESLIRLRLELAGLTEMLGNAAAARALRIAPRLLGSMLSAETPIHENIVGDVLAQIARVKADVEKLCAERYAELQRLHQLVQEFGLRGAARQLGIDPSNFSRKLQRFDGGQRKNG